MERIKNLLIIIYFALFSISILAITQMSGMNIYAKTTNLSSVMSEQYKKELNLTLPEVIDDPALSITFVNPSDDKKHPIEITIDKKTYKKVKSPFKLPNLSLGTHTITFKYTNKDGIPRTLTLNITVVPKAPVIDKKNVKLFFRPDPIEIHGQAIAFSKVMVIVNGQDVQYLDVDADGKWNFVIKTPKIGMYKLMFFTYDSGVISKQHAYWEVEYKAGKIQGTITPTPKPSLINRTKSLVLNNKQYLFGALAVGIGISLIIFAFKLKKYFKKKWETKEISELIQKQKPNATIDEITNEVKNKRIKIDEVLPNKDLPKIDNKSSKKRAPKNTTKTTTKNASKNKAKDSKKTSKKDRKQNNKQNSNKSNQESNKNTDSNKVANKQEIKKPKQIEKSLSKDEFLSIFEKPE